MKKPIAAQLILTAVSAIFLVACHTSKKSTTSTASAPVTTTAPTTPPSAPPGPGFSLANPGYYDPGDAELAAIKPGFNDATMEHLKTGYKLYIGVCTGCHKADNIYSHSEQQWYYTIDKMAPKANLTKEEKNALIKYVMAIKATQQK